MMSKNTILECLGALPARVGLDTKIVDSIDKGTHTLQLVGYNVEEGERVNAWLLIPKKIAGKCPAIIALHQHNGEYFLGKSEPAGLSRNPMYHYGLELCLRGYVVLCPDHLGFEDRRPTEYIRMENPHLDGGGYESYLFTKYYLTGRTLQGKYVSDLSRGVDLLESLEYVDAGRIGAIGHSLGGQEALWLTWFDPRIRAGVSSCGFSQLRSIVRDGINHNLAMYTSGFLKEGDIADLVCGIAPRPFMFTNGTADRIFPLDGVKEIAEAAQGAYASAGVPGNVRSVIFEGPHSFPDEIRQSAYEWLDTHL